MLLDNVLSGFQMPPEIGIGDFSGEETQETDCGEDQGGPAEPRRLRAGGRCWWRRLPALFSTLRGAGAAHGSSPTNIVWVQVSAVGCADGRDPTARLHRLKPVL